MKRLILILGAALAFFAFLLVSGALFIVDETQQVVITRFGEPKRAITSPGLNIKVPFLDQRHIFERRFLEWDGDRNEIPTQDKRLIFVDTYARWQIIDPIKFFQRLTNERRAQSRLDDILDGETRNTIAKHNLIEVVRSTDREFTVVEEMGGDDGTEEVTHLAAGRATMEAEVLSAAQGRVTDLGISILDFRFKRLNYVKEVSEQVYARMISERKRIAEQFRSEGAGEAARIAGEKDRDLKVIQSEAYRQAQEIKGKADAAAADIYAKAYNRDPEFYRFLKTMDVFKTALDPETVLLLGTDGDLMRYLEHAK